MNASYEDAFQLIKSVNLVDLSPDGITKNDISIVWLWNFFTGKNGYTRTSEVSIRPDRYPRVAYGSGRV